MKNVVPAAFTQQSPAVRVPKAAELVAADIRRQIVRGMLHVDDLLPGESALMDVYDVSRPTLREALRILESERLISIKRGARGGAHVQNPEVAVVGRHAGLLLQARDTTIVDVLRARQALEPAAVRLLAEEADASTVDALRTTLAAEEGTASGDSGAGDHRALFHERLVQIGGNFTLALFVSTLAEILARHALAAGAGRMLWEALADDPAGYHREVVELVAARDAAGAEGLWQRHLAEAADRAAGLLGDAKVADLLD